MSSSAPKENLTKLSSEDLEEQYERQMNIVKNKKLVNHLPDKGKQLENKLKDIQAELQLRRSIKEIEGNMKTLNINCMPDISKEKHVQYICSVEKSPKKECYKPFATLVKQYKDKPEKVTQLISLIESMDLMELMEQTKLQVEYDLKVVEEKQEDDEEAAYHEIEEEHLSDIDDKLERI